MKRFTSPWSSILEYFSGISPPEFYSLKASRDQEQKQLDELSREQRLLERARQRLDKSVTLSGPKLDPANFEQEIARLSKEVTELNLQQEILRDKVVREEELFHSLQLQIRLSEDALGIYSEDSTFLRQTSEESLICPTCGAEHAKTFLQLIGYAEEARVLQDLTFSLRHDLIAVQEKIGPSKARLEELQTQYRLVSDVLDTRKGDMQFRDVVNSIGAESAFKAFEDEQKDLGKELDKCLRAVHDLDQKLKDLRSIKRSKRILGAFRNYYATARKALNLPTVETSRLRLTSRPDTSGSGGPRSILAYYSALWRTCHGDAAAYSIPVVIDSPNQQGQDEINLPAVLRFIAQDLPSNMQLLVGLETPADFMFDKEIKLEVPYELLRKEEFAEVEERLLPFIRSMHESIRTQTQMLI